MKKIFAFLLFCQLVWCQTTVVVTGNQKIASSVIVTFTASVTPAVTYNLYRSDTHLGPYSPISTGQACCQVSDKNVHPHHTYYYVMTATDGSSNESDNSNETSAVIP